MAKTLCETIKETINGKGSKAMKSEALIKLGVRPHELPILWAQYYEGSTNEKFSFCFGVEMETFLNRASVESKLRENGVNYNWTGRYYHSNGNSLFEFKRDGSLYHDHTIDANNETAIECVSPVLNGKKSGFDALKACCNTLTACGAQCNRTTGLHVHISCKGMSDEWFVNVFKNYQKIEKVVDGFMPSSRRGSANSDYCNTLARVDFSDCRTIRDVQSAMGLNRYYKLNAMSYDAHKTIELRHHSGSTNYEKVSNWVKFFAALIEWSKKNVFETTPTCVDELSFLDSKLKKYYNKRTEHFASRVAA